MKHLTSRPDLAALPEPYRGIVARALAKDPAKRPASAYELLGPDDAPKAPPVRFIGEGTVEAPSPPLPPEPQPQEEILRIEAEEPVFYIGPNTWPTRRRPTWGAEALGPAPRPRGRLAGSRRPGLPGPPRLVPPPRSAAAAAGPSAAARRPGPGGRAGDLDAPGRPSGRPARAAGRHPAGGRPRPRPAAGRLPDRPDAAGDLGRPDRQQALGRTHRRPGLAAVHLPDHRPDPRGHRPGARRVDQAQPVAVLADRPPGPRRPSWPPGPATRSIPASWPTRCTSAWPSGRSAGGS